MFFLLFVISPLVQADYVRVVVVWNVDQHIQSDVTSHPCWRYFLVVIVFLLLFFCRQVMSAKRAMVEYNIQQDICRSDQMSHHTHACDIFWWFLFLFS